RHAIRGYRLNVHVNGQSKKGYALALIAALAGRLTFRPALVTFHGGLNQEFFPRRRSSLWFWAFKLLFVVAGGIACDDAPIKRGILDYGITSGKVATIETFSPQYLDFHPVALDDEAENFLQNHQPIFFCYVSFRPEYRLEMLREAMSCFRARYANAGFIWLGFPQKEMPAAQEFVSSWPDLERRSLLLLGNQTHDQFLTLLSRSDACIRTPACDGVAASVLEALAMGVPVVASENGRRPQGTVNYEENSAADLCNQLFFLMEHYGEIKSGLAKSGADDNVGRMADW